MEDRAFHQEIQECRCRVARLACIGTNPVLRRGSLSIATLIAAHSGFMGLEELLFPRVRIAAAIIIETEKLFL